MSRELDEEIREHIARETQDNVDRGMSPEAARRAAMRKFGNVTRAKEEAWEIWSIVWLEQLLQDFRLGLRMMYRNPGFTAIAVFTLALGIGASTAIFSVVETALIEPFAYADAPRYMVIQIQDIEEGRPGGRMWFRGPEFLDYANQNHVFDRVMGSYQSYMLYRSATGTESFLGGILSPGSMEFLGMPALLGRVLQPADYATDASPVFVMRYATWVSRFNGDPSIVGRTFVLDGDEDTGGDHASTVCVARCGGMVSRQAQRDSRPRGPGRRISGKVLVANGTYEGRRFRQGGVCGFDGRSSAARHRVSEIVPETLHRESDARYGLDSG
jgi:putative ABC transport system permease protein